MKFELLDWILLIVTLFSVILYGIYKSRTQSNLEGYFLSGRNMPWWLVMLSIMGTQASAITFLTAPGQAYTDGMRFVQYYFGLPLAMVVLCITFVPIFHKLKVFTAYEFLERRFDVKTRLLTSMLFLLSRGLSTGISIFAPSLVLHSMLGWDIYWTNIFMGGLLIVYTVTGGARAVAYTQQLQFLIIYVAMFAAGWYAVQSLPEGLGIGDALHVAGKSGKLNVITTGVQDGGFDWKDKYNIWSGIIGGFFLALSYFGTDQSQVGRYLTAKNLSESRTGLLMNGVLKVPLQFLILLLGCLVFAYYSYYKSPAFFNRAQEEKVMQTAYVHDYEKLKNEFAEIQSKKKETAVRMSSYLKQNEVALVNQCRVDLLNLESETNKKRAEIKQLIKNALPGADTNDTNYIFLHFVGDVLPKGWVGIIIAIIFLAAWGSIAAALNSLSSSTLIDFHQRLSKRTMSETESVKLGKLYTFLWGVFCILIAQFAFKLGNSLIEAVNILGSWFYGTILGIFLVAFYLKKVQSNHVFIAALITEVAVIAIYFMDVISFLWLNVIGAIGVLILSFIFSRIYPLKQK
ncbi:MAG: sodium:solute symporter [Bacteroidota bacterium]